MLRLLYRGPQVSNLIKNVRKRKRGNEHKDDETGVYEYKKLLICILGGHSVFFLPRYCYEVRKKTGFSVCRYTLNLVLLVL